MRAGWSRLRVDSAPRVCVARPPAPASPRSRSPRPTFRDGAPASADGLSRVGRRTGRGPATRRPQGSVADPAPRSRARARSLVPGTARLPRRPHVPPAPRPRDRVVVRAARSAVRPASAARFGRPGRYARRAHHVHYEDGARNIMIASLRYLDSFAKIDGCWYFAERTLVLDWSETRSMATPAGPA